jgi:hypothetical protein
MRYLVLVRRREHGMGDIGTDKHCGTYPEGVAGRGIVLKCNRADSREVGRRRDQIVGQCAGQQLPVCSLEQASDRGAAFHFLEGVWCLVVEKRVKTKQSVRTIPMPPFAGVMPNRTGNDKATRR